MATTINWDTHKIPVGTQPFHNEFNALVDDLDNMDTLTANVAWVQSLVVGSTEVKLAFQNVSNWSDNQQKTFLLSPAANAKGEQHTSVWVETSASQSTNNKWMIYTGGPAFDLRNYAPAGAGVTPTSNTGDGVDFTLDSGSWADPEDVGKIIKNVTQGETGEAMVASITSSTVAVCDIATPFTDTQKINTGDWYLQGGKFVDVGGGQGDFTLTGFTGEVQEVNDWPTFNGGVPNMWTNPNYTLIIPGVIIADGQLVSVTLETGTGHEHGGGATVNVIIFQRNGSQAEWVRDQDVIVVNVGSKQTISLTPPLDVEVGQEIAIHSVNELAAGGPVPGDTVPYNSEAWVGNMTSGSMTIAPNWAAGRAEIYLQASINATLAPFDQYIVAITNDSDGQVTTTGYQTLHEIIATASAGVVYGAISTDGRDTWTVVGVGQIAQRRVATNKTSIHGGSDGAWFYNSNVSYGSETWTAASVDDRFIVLEDAATVTVNRMTPDEMKAPGSGGINFATLSPAFSFGATFDFALLIYATGAPLPVVNGVVFDYSGLVDNVLATHDFTVIHQELGKVVITAPGSGGPRNARVYISK